MEKVLKQIQQANAELVANMNAQMKQNNADLTANMNAEFDKIDAKFEQSAAKAELSLSLIHI